MHPAMAGTLLAPCPEAVAEAVDLQQEVAVGPPELATQCLGQASDIKALHLCRVHIAGCTRNTIKVHEEFRVPSKLQ